jgi:hypothetical protein
MVPLRGCVCDRPCSVRYLLGVLADYALAQETGLLNFCQAAGIACRVTFGSTVVCGAVPQTLCFLGRTESVLGRRCRFDTRTLPSASGTYGDKAKPPGYVTPAALLFGMRPAALIWINASIPAPCF